MDLLKDVELKYEGGKFQVSVPVAALVNPELDGLKKKVEDGSLDLIKGTDLDKYVLLQCIDLVKAYLNK